MNTRPLLCGLVSLALCGAPAHAAAAKSSTGTADRPRHANADITGTVTDSTNGQPLQAAEVSVRNAGSNIISNTATDAFGRFTVHNIAGGTYTITVHMLGFRPITRPLTVAATSTAPVQLAFAMTPIGLNLEAVQVTATTPISVDTRTGDQVFKQNDYHGAPTNTTSQILQTSIAGAARAPTGEVHIRGQHAEYTYYIDGVPVPPGISGSLNELFDPQVVNQIDFQTGGWDAEYGGRNAAVVNVSTKIPAGGFHGSVGSYAGAFSNSALLGPTGFNGQSASVSGNTGPWGMFFSGARQFTNMRLEPVAFDTAGGGNRILNLHNNGTDYFGFGKIQFAPSASNVFTLELNTSQTNLAVPLDTNGGNFANDHQKDQNSFVNLGFHHLGVSRGTNPGSDFFAGFFYRYASLHYTPDPRDQPSFVFFPDVADTFNLAENRSANIFGVKADYAIHPANELEFRFGTLMSATRGREDFSTFNATTQGPQSNSDLNGHDFGYYAQTAYSPREWMEIRAGLRYDAHAQPGVGGSTTFTQFSPRVRLNLYPTSSTTLYGYYGRLFMPTNIEDLRAITEAAQGGTIDSSGTQPERDHFFEAGLIQRFPRAGVTTKLSFYHKQSDPGIDDQTVSGSQIVTDVNIEHVRINGVEAVVEYRPDGPVNGYINAALNHAYGYGLVTGGFFPASPPDAAFFDLDHDQRLSIVGSLNYSPNRWYLSGTAIYGSGLTNGEDASTCNCEYGTGVFDWNGGTHVNPTTIFNAATGYTFIAGKTVLQPELYVENVFNRQYLLKGAFFSGPSIGRPRSVQVRMKLSF
ncbi:MAG TPA: TonB-dependent receptor [Gemmatimonadaceae bacterium]|jgi:hypothetical protein|nr:TonB-dependent receptor [Gemmatimonadaceae bacterium]